MARPTKEGLGYFNLDCDFFQNIKVRKINRACGSQSVSVLICLLCNIYRGKGYYIVWDEDLPFLIADEIGVSEGAVTEIVKKAIQVGFFDAKLSEEGILTSEEIQVRYSKICKDAKRTEWKIEEQWSLLPERKVRTPEVTPVITGITQEETELLPPNNRQSKVKESKEEKSKENESVLYREPAIIPVLPPHSPIDLISLDEIYKILFAIPSNEKTWLISIASTHKLTDKQLGGYLVEFFKKLRADGVVGKDMPDFKKYFNSWLSLQLKNNPKIYRK